MTTMRRLRVEWNGLGGLPGLSTFYFGVASPNVSAVTTFFNAIKGYMPTSLSLTIPSSGDELDDATGALTGVWSGSGGGTVTGTSSGGTYAAGIGAAVQWNTGVIHRGRRVRGRTFLCPLDANVYDAQGTIGTTQYNAIGAAAAAMVASGVAWGIWSRPVSGTGGLYAAVNGYTLPDRVTSLRSRRY